MPAVADSPFLPDHAAILRHIAESRIGTPDDMLGAAQEIERLREQVQYRDDVIAMLRADVARLGSFLHPIGEEARRG